MESTYSGTLVNVITIRGRGKGPGGERRILVEGDDGTRKVFLAARQIHKEVGQYHTSGGTTDLHVTVTYVAGSGETLIATSVVVHP